MYGAERLFARARLLADRELLEEEKSSLQDRGETTSGLVTQKPVDLVGVDTVGVNPMRAFSGDSAILRFMPPLFERST